MAAIDAGIITDSVRAHLLELENEKKDLEYGIAKAELDEPEITRDQIVYTLERFRRGNVNDIAYRIFLVETFLDKAFLYDDGKLILSLNYSGSNNKVTLDIAEEAVLEGEALAEKSSNLDGSSPPNTANLNLIFYNGILVLFAHVRTTN